MLEWHDLNARHEATILWGAALLAIAVAKSPEVRRAILRLGKTLLEPPISILLSGLFVNAAFITALAVCLGRKVGLWETLPLVTATIWSLTTGVSLLFHLGEFIRSSSEFRKRAIRILGPSTIATEIVGIAILAFWIELVLVPLLLLLTLSALLIRSTGLRVISASILSICVVGLISSVAIDLIKNAADWQPLAQAILFPIVLTIGTLHYIQLQVVVERRRFRTSAKRKTVRASEYGVDWPLTVSEAELCYKYGAVWVEVKGKKYGVNGFAKTLLRNNGYECLDLDDIWRDDPKMEEYVDALGSSAEEPPWKVSISRLIQDGLDLER